MKHISNPNKSIKICISCNFISSKMGSSADNTAGDFLTQLN